MCTGLQSSMVSTHMPLKVCCSAVQVKQIKNTASILRCCGKKDTESKMSFNLLLNLFFGGVCLTSNIQTITGVLVQFSFGYVDLWQTRDKCNGHLGARTALISVRTWLKHKLNDKYWSRGNTSANDCWCCFSWNVSSDFMLLYICYMLWTYIVKHHVPPVSLGPPGFCFRDLLQLNH